MFGLGLPELLLVMIVAGIPIWITARVASKAGFSRWWSLTTVVPVVNVIVLYLFAYSLWPRIDASAGLTEGSGDGPRQLC